MKISVSIVGGLLGGFLIVGASAADGSFADHMNSCVEKFASPGEGASVVMECTAGGGKLSDCKVVENSAPSKGFDKAAICVSEFLPIGSKTGTIRVPLKFAGA